MQWKFNPNEYVPQEVVEEEIAVHEEPEEEYQPESDPVWDARWAAFVSESNNTSRSTRTKMTPDEKIDKVIECLVTGVDDKSAYMTREEIGIYLQYENPADSLSKMHKAHFAVLEPLSEKRDVLDSRGCIREKAFYNPEGVFEAVHFSRQHHIARDFLRRFIDRVKQKNSVTGVTN